MHPDIISEDLLVFRRAVNQLHPITDDEFELLEQFMHLKKYAKGEQIFMEGQQVRSFWFIIKGAFRIFRLEGNEEVNVSFFFENKLAGDFISLSHDSPSDFFMEALEETYALIAYKKEYKKVLPYSKFFIELTSEFFRKKYFEEYEHSNTFKLLKPEDRYLQLLKNNPKYIQRIPLTHLASYLGISRKTLTRIRSKIA